MSRRRRAETRVILPDPKYRSVKVTKFMNCLMLDGKKSVAEGIVYGAFEHVARRTKREPLEIFDEALDNVSPLVEVRSRRVGGATYQVPMEVAPRRRMALAMRWIIKAANARGERTMMARLCGELADAAENRGSAVKKREETHRMADANKAFSHYRW